MRLLRDGLAKFYAAIWLNLLVLITFVDFSDAINCYSGSQLQIIECSSLSCIKQTLGLDTVCLLKYFFDVSINFWSRDFVVTS